MNHSKTTLALALPLAAALGGEAAAQCFTGSCQEGTTIQTSDTQEVQLLGAVPFRRMTLAADQFDPAFYADLHDVPVTGITLLGVSVDFYGEINPLVQLDSGSTPQACTAEWHYDVESVIFTNPDIGNPGLLVIFCQGGTANLPAGNGGPPPWDATIVPPAATDAFCFADSTDLDAWIGDGQVEFETDGLEFSSASGCTDTQSNFTNQGLLRMRVTYTYCVDGDPPGDVGVPYCFCDGSGSPPPCNNPGGPDQGCANSTGDGAILSATGSNSVSADDAVFQGDNLRPSQPALLFSGANAVGGGSGTTFGDGLRCAGGALVRFGTDIPDGGGVATWGPGVISDGGWAAGETRRFQVWYRDPNTGPCGSNFNLSNGFEVTFSP